MADKSRYKYFPMLKMRRVRFNRRSGCYESTHGLPFHGEKVKWTVFYPTEEEEDGVYSLNQKQNYFILQDGTLHFAGKFSSRIQARTEITKIDEDWDTLFDEREAIDMMNVLASVLDPNK